MSRQIRGIPKDAVSAVRLLRWQDGLCAVALVAAVFFVYQPCWNGTFLFDDDIHLSNNPVLHAGGLAKIWVPGGYLSYWPLTFTSYWLEFHLWALNPLGYHLVNIAMHALSALLVRRVLLRLQIPGAMFAAALFALHPVNVESVAWIAQLKGILSLALALVSVLFYLSNERHPNGWRYGAAIVTFLLSALAKGTALTLPIVLLACAWWQRGRITRRDLLRVLPYVVIGAVMARLEIWGQHNVGHGEIVRTDGFFSRAAVAGCALWFYLGKLIWPLDLSPIYPRWKIDQLSLLWYLPGILWIGLLAWAWWRRGNWGRPIVMLMVCYGALVLPVLGFVNINFMRYSLVADHWQYIATIVPCAAFAGAVTMLVRRAMQWPTAISARSRAVVPYLAATALLVVLGVLSRNQAGAYDSADAFYAATIAKNPDCWLAENNLGNALLVQGKLGSAIEDFQKALDIKPDYAEAHNNMALALADSGKSNSAIGEFRKAFEIKPNYAEPHNNLGNIFALRGDVGSAIAEYEKALEINPGYDAAHYNLAVALAGRGETAAAISHYEAALKINPEYTDAHNNLAAVLLAQGKIESAIFHLQKALEESKPDNPEIHNNLAAAFVASGRLDEAIAQYQTALQLKPDYAEARKNLAVAMSRRAPAESSISRLQEVVANKPDNAEAHYSLGNALFGHGQVDAAIAQYQKALEIKPRFAEAHGNLATALASIGDIDSAIAHYRKALEIKPDNKLARQNLAVVQTERERILKMVAQQREALKLKPNDAAILNDMAWTLATNPNASIRNGAEAIELAERASKLPDADKPAILNTLAAAYAETGRFPEAVRTAGQAAQLASAAGNQKLVEQIRSGLKLYKDEEPYRQRPSR